MSPLPTVNTERKAEALRLKNLCKSGWTHLGGATSIFTPNQIPSFAVEGSGRGSSGPAKHNTGTDQTQQTPLINPSKQTQAHPHYLAEVLAAEIPVFPWDAAHEREEAETELQV